MCREKYIEINPHMMPWWDKVTFSFYYKGSKFKVEMDNNRYLLETDSEKDTVVIFKGEKCYINRENELVKKVR